MTSTDFHRDKTQVDVPPGLVPGDKLYVCPPPIAAGRFCNQILRTSPPGFKQNAKICCPALDDTSLWPEDESAWWAYVRHKLAKHDAVRLVCVAPIPPNTEVLTRYRRVDTSACAPLGKKMAAKTPMHRRGRDERNAGRAIG
jgi:hypothetical protein